MSKESLGVSAAFVRGRNGGKRIVMELPAEAVRRLEGMAIACEEDPAEMWADLLREVIGQVCDSWLDPSQFQGRWDWSAERSMRCGRAFSLVAGRAIYFPLDRQDGRHDVVFQDGRVVAEIGDGECVPPPPGWVDPDALAPRQKKEAL